MRVWFNQRRDGMHRQSPQISAGRREIQIARTRPFTQSGPSCVIIFCVDLRILAAVPALLNPSTTVRSAVKDRLLLIA